MSQNFIRSVLLFCLLFFCYTSGYSQSDSMSLDEAIQLAKENSFDYKVAINRFQTSTWDFKNYQVAFLPSLYLNGTVPNYNRTITKITLPNGEDTFVRQNQSYSSLNLGLSQQIAATGGRISLASSFNRLDVFGSSRFVNYSSIPVSVSYSQDAIGYNSFMWQRKIAPLQFSSAEKGLIISMEQISYQTVGYYFDMLTVQSIMKLDRQNLANADTLYEMAQERLKLGTVSKSDLLQLRLNVLNSENQLTNDSTSLVLARQKLTNYLSLPESTALFLKIPDNPHFFPLRYDDAIAEARKNSKAVIEFKLQRLEAERALAETKSQNNLKFNVQANFGLSNTSANIPGLFNNLESQQNILIGFSLPLLDWGQAKIRKERAKANLSMVENQVKHGEMEMEQEIALQAAKWNLLQRQVDVAAETQRISIENYEMEKQRYLMGNITINDLNAARQLKDNAANNYIGTLRRYWESYYIIRKLTLYDFEKNRKIVVFK
ncbi:TolC family protein [Arcticibacter tournemirensis]|uniref:TolC family protein n=1 Tax=Arcticibacter tournemirensis TaxID=699437 RepID=A0A4Q0MF52_9SPHI|nr:TolC family protein [Arcticibacter tournemirensis]RXF71823.1 TolC family protein [Arcticibacter tournemirensis]